MEPEILLSAFGERIGIQPLSFNENNEVRLIIGEHLVDLFYKKDKDIILFATPVTNIIVSENSFVFANLLELNLAYALTGGGTVGFDRRDNKLHYVSFISMKGINVDAFEEFISSSLSAVNLLLAAVSSREFSVKKMSFLEDSSDADLVDSALKV